MEDGFIGEAARPGTTWYYLDDFSGRGGAGIGTRKACMYGREAELCMLFNEVGNYVATAHFQIDMQQNSFI